MKKLKLLPKETLNRNVAQRLREQRKLFEKSLDWNRFTDFSLNNKDSTDKENSYLSTSKLTSSSTNDDRSTTSNENNHLTGEVGETMIISMNPRGRRKSQDSVSSNKNLSISRNEVPQTSTIMLPDVSSSSEASSVSSSSSNEDDGFFLKKVSVMTKNNSSLKQQSPLIDKHYLMNDAETMSSSNNSTNSSDNNEDGELFNADPISADDFSSPTKNKNFESPVKNQDFRSPVKKSQTTFLLRTPLKNKSLAEHMPLSPSSPNVKSSGVKVRPFTINDLSGGMVEFDKEQSNKTRTLPLPMSTDSSLLRNTSRILDQIQLPVKKSANSRRNKKSNFLNIEDENEKIDIHNNDIHNNDIHNNDIPNKRVLRGNKNKKVDENVNVNNENNIETEKSPLKNRNKNPAQPKKNKKIDENVNENNLETEKSPLKNKIKNPAQPKKNKKVDENVNENNIETEKSPLKNKNKNPARANKNKKVDYNEKSPLKNKNKNHARANKNKESDEDFNINDIENNQENEKLPTQNKIKNPVRVSKNKKTSQTLNENIINENILNKNYINRSINERNINRSINESNINRSINANYLLAETTTKKLTSHMEHMEPVSAYKDIISRILSPRRVLKMSDVVPNNSKGSQPTINPHFDNNFENKTIENIENLDFLLSQNEHLLMGAPEKRISAKSISKLPATKKQTTSRHTEAPENVRLHLKNSRKRRHGNNIELEGETNGEIRRSSRHRVQPLRYWENEYIDYKLTEEGFVFNKIVKNKQHQFALSARLSNKKPGEKNIPSKPPKIVEPAPFSIIDPNTSKHEHHFLVWPHELVNVNSKNITNKTPQLQTDTYLKYDNISVGQVVLRPKAEKGLYLSKDHIIMHVLQGYGVVTIAQKQENIAVGTSIVIPKENVYNIQNLSSRRSLRILFVICEPN